MTLVGHFLGAEGRRARFAPDLAESVAWGDARYRDIMDLAMKTVDARGIARPEIAVPEPFDGTAPEEVSLEGFGAVLFAGGFRPDYRSWLPWTDAFDASGFPIQVDGASSVVDGLFFVGTASTDNIFGGGLAPTARGGSQTVTSPHWCSSPDRVRS